MSKEKVGMTADKISEKWGKNMKASVSYIQTGIDGVTVSPMSKAADQKAKYLQNIMEAADRWEKNLRGGSLSAWKEITKKKVQERLSGGVDGAMPKHKKFAAWLVNRENQILPEIAAMPNMVFSDSLNRMTTWATRMHEQKYKDTV